MEVRGRSGSGLVLRKLTRSTTRSTCSASEVSEGALHIFQNFVREMTRVAATAPVEEAGNCGAVDARRRSERLRTIQDAQVAATSNSRFAPPELHTPASWLGRNHSEEGEPFVKWRKSRSRMAPSASKSMKRRISPPRGAAGDGKQGRRPDNNRTRVEGERRSKEMHDRPTTGALKGKGAANQRSPVPKKKKLLDISELESSARDTADEDEQWSAGDATGDEEDAGSDLDGSGSPSQPEGDHRQGRQRVMKKPVTLDVNGLPWGNLKECLSDDIKKYAKSLDPTANWESQPGPLRSHLFRRLYKEWDMLGQSIKLSEKWVGPIITKVLITTRWRLNTLIDAGQPKPADVTQEQWNTLVRRRNTEESQITSEHMRSISQGKGSRTAQLKAIERDAIVKLTLQHSRKPYQTEITDEVAREYTRQQLEKWKASLRKGADMEDVRTRVVDIEGSVARLEDKIGESHKRMEEMLHALITSQAAGPSTVPEAVHPRAPTDVVPDASEKNMPGKRPPASATTDFVDLSPMEGDPRTSGVDYDDGDELPKKTAAVDVGVEEFLEGLLQDPDAPVGEAEAAKSADTVLLTGEGDEVSNDVVSPNAAPLENCREASAKEDDAAEDSILRLRRSAAKANPSRSTSITGSMKISKGGPAK